MDPPLVIEEFLQKVSLIEIGLVLVAVPLLAIGIVLFVVNLYFVYRGNRVAEFQRKRVFVTGTDTGFGRELVLKLDKQNLIVYAGCYTKEGGQKLKEITSDNVRILDIDVVQRDTLEQARDFIEKDLPPGEGLWGLVNNAHTVRGTLFDFCTERDFRDTMEVNFYGTIRTVEIFAPLVKRARGRIVNVSRYMGHAFFGSEPYTCSSHVLQKYNDGLRRVMNAFDVHVALVESGFYSSGIDTEQKLIGEFDRAWDQAPKSLREEYGMDYCREMRNQLKEFNKANTMMTSFMNKMSDVPKAVVHALSSTRPKDRYLCGIDAYVFSWIVALIPCWVQDLYMVPMLKYYEMARHQH